MDATTCSWSPSLLHDVVGPAHAHARPSNLPPPPSGHDLMRMFPAPSPALPLPAPGSPRGFPAPTPTSGWFERQEHAFFAKAGKEIVRVRKDTDAMRDGAPARSASVSSGAPTPFAQYQSQSHGQAPLPPPLPQGLAYPPGPHPHAIPHPLPPPHHHHHLPQSEQMQAPMASLHSSPQPSHYPLQSQRLSPSTKPIQPIVVAPASSAPAHAQNLSHYREHTVHHQQQQQQSVGAGARSHSAHSSVSSSQPSPPGPQARSPASPSDRERDAGESFDPSDPNESWRRPMPHAERRRAGKHTRRVVVKA